MRGCVWWIGLGTIAAALDDERRAVIRELLMTYRDW
jgi:hypothetical protein